MEIDTINHPQDPLETPQSPSSNNNKLNQKGVVPVIVGVIILILVVLGGIYYLGTKKEQQSIPPQIQNSAKPTATADNSNGWEVYETNGYQIKVPSGWNLFVRGKKKEPSQTFSEYVKQRGKNNQIIFQKEITIGNRKAIILDETYTWGHGLAGIVEIDKDFIFIVNGNKQGYFERIENLQNPEQKYNDTDYQNFEQILKTLQIRDLLNIESEDQWKTYSDQNSVFSIKYPSIFNETKNTYINSSTIKSGGALTTMYPYNGVGGPKDIAFQFNIIPKNSTESLEQFVNRIANERKGEPGGAPINTDSELKKEITIDEKRALWYEGRLGPSVSHDEIFIPKDELTVVRLLIYTGEGGTPDIYKKEHLALIESMLPSFKFVK